MNKKPEIAHIPDIEEKYNSFMDAISDAISDWNGMRDGTPRKYTKKAAIRIRKHLDRACLLKIELRKSMLKYEASIKKIRKQK